MKRLESYLVGASSASTLEQCGFALALIGDVTCAEDGLSDDGVTGLGFLVFHIRKALAYAAEQDREERQALQLKGDELEALRRDPEALATALAGARKAQKRERQAARCRAKSLRAIEGLQTIQ